MQYNWCYGKINPAAIKFSHKNVDKAIKPNITGCFVLPTHKKRAKNLTN